jgi:hypothetical protein
MTEATALAHVAELAAAHGLHASSGQCADPSWSHQQSPAGDAAVAPAAVGGAWVAAGARAVWFRVEESMVRAVTDGEFVRIGACSWPSAKASSSPT